MVDSPYCRGTRQRVHVRKIQVGGRIVRGGVYESYRVVRGKSQGTPAASVSPGQRYFVKLAGTYRPAVADEREVMHLLDFRKESVDPRTYTY